MVIHTYLRGKINILGGTVVADILQWINCRVHSKRAKSYGHWRIHNRTEGL